MKIKGYEINTNDKGIVTGGVKYLDNGEYKQANIYEYNKNYNSYVKVSATISQAKNGLYKGYYYWK